MNNLPDLTIEQLAKWMELSRAAKDMRQRHHEEREALHKRQYQEFQKRAAELEAFVASTIPEPKVTLNFNVSDHLSGPVSTLKDTLG